MGLRLVKPNFKFCTSCKQEVDTNDFYKNSSSKDGLQTHCKSCQKKRVSTPEHRKYANEYMKKRMKTPKGREYRKIYRSREYVKKKEKEGYRRWVLKTQYGISLETYFALLSSQGNKCGLCGSLEAGGPRGGQSFVVDHNHGCCSGKTSCGKCIRGLLCNRCNLALGVLKDEISWLEKAKTYLEVHSNRR